MKLMNANPMARYEYKLAKENRRIAEIDLKKAEIQTMGDRGMEDVLVARILSSRVMWGLLGIILAIIPICSIDGMLKNYHNQTQITQCERLASQAHVEANCATGKIGSSK